MADYTKNNKQQGVPKKADVIIQTEKEISYKVDRILSQMAADTAALRADSKAVLEKCDRSANDTLYTARQNTEIYKKLVAENQKLKQEFVYLAVQSEKVYEGLLKEINKLSERVEALVKGIPEVDYEKLAAYVADNVVARIDEDAFAEKVAAKVPVQEYDYDEAACRVIDSLPAQEVISADYIASKVAEQLIIPQPVDEEELATLVADKVAEQVVIPEPATVDEEVLADSIAAKVPVTEINIDELASKVAEQIIVPDPEEMDYDKLASMVAAAIVVPEAAAAEIDEEKIADAVIEKLSVYEVDEEKIADTVVEKLAAVQPEEITEEVVEEADEEPVAEEAAEEVVAEEQAPVEEEVAEEPVPAFNEEEFAALIADKVTAQIDIDELVDQVAAKLGAVQPDSFDIIVDDEGCAAISQSVAEKINYEELADKVCEKIAANQNAEEPNYDELAAQIAEKVVVPAAEVNEESIAEKTAAIVAERLPEPNSEEIAALVAEKITLPAAEINEESIAEKTAAIVAERLPEPDYDELAAQVAEKVVVPAAEVNEDALADKAAAVLSNYLPEINADEVAEKVVAGIEPLIPAAPEVDCEAISSSVAEKVIASQAENDYDIVLDEESLARLSENVSASVSEKTAEHLAKVSGEIAGVDEHVGRVEEKVDGINGGVAQVGEKVTGVDEHIGKVDEEILAIEDCLTSDDGKTEEVKDLSSERFDKLDSDIDKLERGLAEIKAMIAAGAVVAAVAGSELAATEAVAEEEPEEEEEAPVAEEPVAEQPAEEAEEAPAEEAEQAPAEEEAKEELVTAEALAEEAEEELVTVSDLVEEAEEEEELVTVSDLVEETEAEAAEENAVIDEIVEEIDEQPVSGEIMPDGIPGISNGVDFINMMKYNRSFIARIIQSDDNVKQYYGQTKNAMLSYKKVNSSIAWGAERFNKGRETIAKFKIRGKTLCLYLALDPKEYKTSVYHQVDVSDNKSMKGTPMMVKIKSPLGVKKAIRLIDEMLEKRGAVKQNIKERDYAAMYPYETIEELIEDGLVKDVSKNR